MTLQLLLISLNHKMLKDKIMNLRMLVILMRKKKVNMFTTKFLNRQLMTDLLTKFLLNMRQSVSFTYMMDKDSLVSTNKKYIESEEFQQDGTIIFVSKDILLLKLCSQCCSSGSLIKKFKLLEQYPVKKLIKVRRNNMNLISSNN